MTGHRPDQPGTQDPSDSESQNAGADVSADEFAAALKLIVKRLEGQDDGAETPPLGSDSEGVSAAVPTTAALDSAPEPAAKDPLWTGLSDSPAPEPAPSQSDSHSPLAGGFDAASTSAGISESAESGTSSGATTAADLWPAPSSEPEDSAFAPESATVPNDPLFTEATGAGKDPLFSESSPDAAPKSEDPLFTETAGAGNEPLFSESPPDPAPKSEDPLFTDAAGSSKEPLFSEPPSIPEPEADPLLGDPPDGVSAKSDPLFSPAAEPEGGGKEPLFVDSSTSTESREPLFVEDSVAQPAAEDPLFAPASKPAATEDPLFTSAPQPSTSEDPLFVETPSQGGDDPLFAEKPQSPDQSAFAVESSPEPEPQQPDAPFDPMAGLRNQDDGPTIGPAMPGPELTQSRGATVEPEEPGPTPAAIDTSPIETPAIETPEIKAPSSDELPTRSGTESALDYPEPSAQAVETPANDGPDPQPTGGLGGAANDPFAGATRPAFEDDSASALFGDSPDLAAQNAPGSSLGPIGAEAEDFESQPQQQAAGASAQPDSSAAAQLTATRDLDEEADSNVELDQILPPLEPGAESLEKAADPPRPRRKLQFGAPVFWMLILAILGGISYWGYQQRQQTVALAEWAQARYALPTGQLAALLATYMDRANPDDTADEALPPTPQLERPVEPEPPAPETAAVQPPPTPEPPPAAAAAPPSVAEPAPAPAPVPAPTSAPEATPPPPASTAVEPVTVATTSPARLPDHLAPLPANASPQIQTLADRALSGDPLAQHDLANQYAVGETVAQSNSYAAYWYRLASEAGIANAQYNLGVLTARGLGVRKDLETAFRLFLAAAEAGHADAQTAAGLAYMYGSGIQQNRLQAASWFQAASANGRPRGAYHLGQLFELGLDEPPDLAAAAGWYRIAADAGYSQAQESLDRLTAATRPEPAPPPAPSSVAAPATTPTPVPPSPDPIPAEPSELVREIQQLLNGFGYDAGSEDGRVGQKTTDAISAFQRSQGLYVTGEASAGLRDLLKTLAAAQ